MNIYDSDGVLSLDAARAAGNALPGANADPKVQAQRLTIAALLDIAESLRPLAAEARNAMQAQESGVRYAPYVDGPPVLEVGDVVYVDGIDAPGEIIGFRDTEGETFADVTYGDEVNGERTSMRVRLSSLHRLVGDEGEEPDPRAEVIIDDEDLFDYNQGGGTVLKPTPGESDFEPIPGSVDNGDGTWTHPGNPNLTDELDEDFDGDAHTAAEDAVAKLAEAEAKRKAEKKKAKK